MRQILENVREEEHTERVEVIWDIELSASSCFSASSLC